MRQVTAACVLASMATVAVAAADAEVLRCRTIADPAQRLACYDKWVDGTGAPAPATTNRPPVAAPAQSATPAPTPVAQAPAAVQFGLEHRREPSAIDAIDSQIVGLFEGWDPGTMITLANGQIWQVADDSRGTYALRDPRVRVRRGMLGAFYLEIDGANRSPRVKRLR